MFALDSSKARPVDTQIPFTHQISNYTVYRIVTSFSSLDNNQNSAQFEVDRRFSQFEQLVRCLREAHPLEVIPDLPKKRFFNN